MKVTQDLLEDLAIEAGIDTDDIRRDYSGRAMYGRECIGIVGTTSDLVRWIIACADHAREDQDFMLTAWEDLRTDSMGHHTIYYWPGIQVEEAS